MIEKNKWNKFEKICKNNLYTLNLFFLSFYCFSSFPFSHIFNQIFWKSNITYKKIIIIRVCILIKLTY